MEQRLVCDTVRDLLPMYIDHMTSEASNESITSHMADCGERSEERRVGKEC